MDRWLRMLPRLIAAGAVAVGGVIHYNLWRGGYRALDTIGPSFAANAAISTVVAVALLVTVDRRVATAVFGLSMGSIIGLVLSRTVGLFGFMDSWTTVSWQAMAAEIAAIVAVGVALAARRPPVPLPARVEP